jgi:hypothetical protein
MLYKWPVSFFVILCIESIVWPLSNKCWAKLHWEFIIRKECKFSLYRA